MWLFSFHYQQPLASQYIHVLSPPPPPPPHHAYMHIPMAGANQTRGAEKGHSNCFRNHLTQIHCTCCLHVSMCMQASCTELHVCYMYLNYSHILYMYIVVFEDCSREWRWGEEAPWPGEGGTMAWGGGCCTPCHLCSPAYPHLPLHVPSPQKDLQTG